MSENRKVSIISPCYNGEKYIARFLDSVLAQTYRNIELIVVNDGSTDCTLEIINSYKEKFIKRGIEFIVLDKENGGQAQALNSALKIFSGDYLIWMDSDDIMYPNHVQEKYIFLEKHKEYGFVSCWADAVYEDKLNELVDVEFRIKPKFKQDNFFADLINEKNVMLNPGVYMVKRDILIQCIPDLDIFVSREGQNFQMLLPIAYCSQCGYLEKPLYKIVRRKNSHSREYRDFEQLLNRVDGLETIMKSTISKIVQMSEEEKNYWIQLVHKKYNNIRIQIAYENNNLELVKKLKSKEQKIYGSILVVRGVAYCNVLKYRIHSLHRKMIARNRK